MPITEYDFTHILAEYDALRKQAKDDQDLRIQRVYQRIPEIQAIDKEIEGFGFRAMKEYLRTRTDPHKLIQDIRKNVEELVARKDALLSGAGFPSDYMDLQYRCPICKDTGYVDNQKCRCLKQRLIEFAYEQSGLGTSYDKENFDTFDLDRFSSVPAEPGGISPRDNMLQIRDTVLRAVNSFSETSEMNFLFYGTTGTGKTFLCNCIARELLERGYTVLYLSAYDFCIAMNDFRFRWRNESSDESASRLMELIDTCDLLIIDDLGTEGTTSFSVPDLLHCINKRIQEYRSTIISTNLNMQQIRKLYSDRLLSRITGHYQLFRFFGPDLRRPV